MALIVSPWLFRRYRLFPSLHAIHSAADVRVWGRACYSYQQHTKVAHRSRYMRRLQNNVDSDRHVIKLLHRPTCRVCAIQAVDDSANILWQRERNSRRCGITPAQSLYAIAPRQKVAGLERQN